MKRGLIFFMVMFAAELTFGQGQQATRILTFEEAIQIALRNSVLFNQQKNNLQFSQIQKTQSIAALGPTLYAQSGFTQINGNFFNSNQGKVVNGLFDQVSGSLQANWAIFNGLSQVNRVKQYSAQLEAQSFYVNRTKQDVLNTVATQYLTLLLDAELLKIAQENFASLDKQLQQVTEQVRLGARSPVDEYNQDSQTKAAQIRAYQAEIQLINDKALLTQTLLMDPDEQFDIAKPDWDVNKIGSEEYALPQLYETALNTRGDYLRAKKNEDGSKYAMKAMKAQFLPTLSAFFSINSFYNRNHGDSVTAPFERQFREDNLRKMYGLQLYVPIFGGNQNLQNRMNYVQQKVNYLNNQITRKNTEIQVKTDVMRAYQNFQLYKRTFEASLAQIKAAEMAFSLESERYNLGITNFVDYANANRAFVQAQTDKAQSEYRLLFQKVVLDYAVGTLREDDL
ncbi:MAG: TolC family protein [Bacteroidetes bacterium]|nr:TolC family protein [Bacteroidota bacterium]